MNEKKFYKAEDIAKVLDVSVQTAYRIIVKLNKELREQGYEVTRGRVVRVYFEERYHCA